MIQDIYPHRLNNQYNKDAKVCKNDFVMYFENSKVLIKSNKDDICEFPTAEELGMELEYIYFFTLDSERYFFTRKIDYIPNGCEMIEVNTLRRSGAGPKHRIFAALTGKHISDWYRDTRFCGRCGHAMVHSSLERAMTCPECKYTAYPRIMPAVIVGVRDGDRLILTKYRTGYANNALVAGFTEIGETVEETVAREVMEETGVKVKNVTYYKSQPWGIANDILMGFYCDLDGDGTIHMDENELKYAEWVRREDIVLQPDDFSLTNEMMYMFKQGLK